MYHLAVAFFQSRPQRGVPGGTGRVWIGRPFLYAAIAGGEAGVQRAISLLRDEINRDLALLGIRSIGEITPDLVRKF